MSESGGPPRSAPSAPPPGYPPQPQYPTGYPVQYGYPVPPGYVVAPGYAVPPPQRHAPSAETQRDAAAAWAARMELGSGFDEHVAAGLAERVEDLAALHLAELRRGSEQSDRAFAAEQKGRGRQFALGVVSTAMAIPITAIATHTPGGHELVLSGLSWAGLIGINVVHALGLRHRKPR